MDENPVIVEGTNKPFLEGYTDSLKEVVEPLKIKYIIIDHAEPDHAGAIKELVELCSNAEVVCSKKGKEFLTEAFSVAEDRIKVVDEGDEINIGKRTLRFLMTPMVHWPETMMTYVVEEKLLFSGDMFATEIAHEKHFADEFDDFSKLTRDYFAIVMRPFHNAVTKAIEKVRAIEVEWIFPSHGPTYKKDINSIIDYYDKLAKKPEENKVLIIYSTIWGSTKSMSEEIAKGIEDEGSKAVMIDIKNANMVQIMAEALTSKAVAVGSLTIAGGAHPDYNNIISYFKLNKQEGKKIALFGSYGWAGAAVSDLKKKFEEIKYEVIDDFEIRFGMKDDEQKERLREIGKELGGL